MNRYVRRGSKGIALLERCGLDPAGWFDEKDFQTVYDFTTPSAVYALGTAVSDCSREVLRQIERTVKTTIRRRNIERSQEEYEQQSELHEDRRLFSAEPDLEAAPEAAESVRKDAPELSDGAAPGGVQHDAAERDPVPAPVGDGTDGREQDAAELLERNPAPDKEKKQMAWVQHMNSLKAQAEEMILTELIYS